MCSGLIILCRQLKLFILLSTDLYNVRQNLAKDEYETNFVSAVVPSGEIGVKFDDIGALEEVKKALNELVILPMRRPELFSHGNLLRVLTKYFFLAVLMKVNFCLFPFLCVTVTCLLALQRNITFWASWNWENPSCQGTCYRSRCKFYQHNWFNPYFKGMVMFSSYLNLNQFLLVNLIKLKT